MLSCLLVHPAAMVAGHASLVSASVMRDTPARLVNLR